MRWLAVACALALLAGCTEGPATPPAADVQPDEPGRTARQGRDRDRGDDEDEEERSGNVTLRSYSDGFAFTLTSANALVRFGNLQGSNCVAVEGAPFLVLNGTATFTWTPQPGLTDELEAELRTYWSDDVYQTVSGPSPLVLEFEDIEVEADRDVEEALLVGIHLPGPVGAAYEQDVSMALAFDYESDIDVYVGDSYC